MSLIANIAPPAVVFLVCVVAYVSVRRDHRKGREVVAAPAPEARPAE
jgi:hypothetical protein